MVGKSWLGFLVGFPCKLFLCLKHFGFNIAVTVNFLIALLFPVNFSYLNLILTFRASDSPLHAAGVGSMRGRCGACQRKGGSEWQFSLRETCWEH